MLGKLNLLIFCLMSASTIAGEKFHRVEKILPIAPPKYLIESGPFKSQPHIDRGDFAVLKLYPKMDSEGNYWKPGSILQAVQEIEKILPKPYYNRLLGYYGLSAKDSLKPLEYVDDESVHERIFDLSYYLIETWDLFGESDLAKQFRCIGIDYGDLSGFFILWANYTAKKKDLRLVPELTQEYQKIKVVLQDHCKTSLHIWDSN